VLITMEDWQRMKALESGEGGDAAEGAATTADDDDGTMDDD
jgi:hypothetical protein